MIYSPSCCFFSTAAVHERDFQTKMDNKYNITVDDMMCTLYLHEVVLYESYDTFFLVLFADQKHGAINANKILRTSLVISEFYFSLILTQSIKWLQKYSACIIWTTFMDSYDAFYFILFKNASYGLLNYCEKNLHEDAKNLLCIPCKKITTYGFEMTWRWISSNEFNFQWIVALSDSVVIANSASF